MIDFEIILQPTPRQPEFSLIATNILLTALLYDIELKNPAG